MNGVAYASSYDEVDMHVVQLKNTLGKKKKEK